MTLVDPDSGLGTKDKPALTHKKQDVFSSFTDGNGNVNTLKTDNFGAIIESTDSCCLGRITSIERDGDGLPTKITRANGAVTTLSYDENGNLLTSTDESIGATTTFTYEPTFNQVDSITDPEGNTTKINYDDNGNPIEIIDALSNPTTMEYNTKGLLTKVIDALSNSTTFNYDANGNLIKITDPLTNMTTLTYDEAGNVISTTDAEGRTTEFVYDAMNRLIQITDANNGITKYEYDENGNLIMVTDAKDNPPTMFEYDSMDRLIKTTDPVDKAETFKYDGNGNLLSTTDRNGQTISFEYDALNQLIKKALPGNLITTFEYDEVGNLISLIDPDSSLIFDYDGASRLISTITAGSPTQPDVTIDYTYDLNGNRLSMKDSLTGTTDYKYDELNRLIVISNPTGQAVNFDYDDLSRRTMTEFPNGVTTTFDYDDISQLTSLAHKLGLTTLSSFEYKYDRVGNRTNLTSTRTGVTVNNNLSYKYDNLNQLIQSTRPLPAQPDETFVYDEVGNRLRRDGQVADAMFDSANRLLQDDDFTYTYDNNGNLVEKTANGTGEITKYTYNPENQLIRIDFPVGGFAEYRYDGLGRRIEKNVDGQITRYVYDNEDILLETDTTDTILARYTHGPGIDEPVIMERGGQSFLYQTDGLGSITELTDSTGAIVRTYIYDSFGNIVEDSLGVSNPYTYTSREFDEESGLYFYRARFYDKAVGRFLKEDLLIRSGSRYGYVNNNPLNFNDPFGLIESEQTRIFQAFRNEFTLLAQQRQIVEATNLLANFLSVAGGGLGAAALLNSSNPITAGLGMALGILSIHFVNKGKELAEVVTEISGDQRLEQLGQELIIKDKVVKSPLDCINNINYNL